MIVKPFGAFAPAGKGSPRFSELIQIVMILMIVMITVVMRTVAAVATVRAIMMIIGMTKVMMATASVHLCERRNKCKR